MLVPGISASSIERTGSANAAKSADMPSSSAAAPWASKMMLMGTLGCTNPLRLFAGELVQPAGKTGPPAQAAIGALRNAPPNTDTLATADAPFDSLAPTFALMTTGTTCPLKGEPGST